MKRTESEGFTVIELLIVVAIAAPNFLLAKVRANVSRTAADMKSLATAHVMCQVDHN